MKNQVFHIKFRDNHEKNGGMINGEEEKGARNRKMAAARQARRREKLKAAGVKVVALTPHDQEALALGRRVLGLGPLKAALVAKVLG